MTTLITRVDICYEQDVVHARQVSRLIAEQLGFDRQNQTRIGTAVSEIARNAYQYAKGGLVEFSIEAMPTQRYCIKVIDSGPGITDLSVILEGGYVSRTGMGLGIVGSKRLMDSFEIDTCTDTGTAVTMFKNILNVEEIIFPQVLARISEVLVANISDSPLEEARKQNQELMSTLEQVHQRDEELLRLNQELAETNTGMIALYADLENKAEQLTQREQMLRSKNEELKGFAYTVSHDLKAPLRGISGYAQEIERRHQDGLTERAQFCITQIITASNNLDGLIEDLLTYSRVDSDTLAVTEVDLSILIEGIMKDRSLVIAEQNIKLTLNVPSITLKIWERGLHQVLTNLIDNAIKYSRNAKSPCLSIYSEKTATACLIVVKDNGIGFDMQYHERIFGLFNRLVRADEFEGSGAGLAIVVKLLNKLGGSIRAESEPEKGATFFVELPITIIRNPLS